MPPGMCTSKCWTGIMVNPGATYGVVLMTHPERGLNRAWPYVLPTRKWGSCFPSGSASPGQTPARDGRQPVPRHGRSWPDIHTGLAGNLDCHWVLTLNGWTGSGHREKEAGEGNHSLGKLRYRKILLKSWFFTPSYWLANRRVTIKSHCIRITIWVNG